MSYVYRQNKKACLLVSNLQHLKNMVSSGGKINFKIKHGMKMKLWMKIALGVVCFLISVGLFFHLHALDIGLAYKLQNGDPEEKKIALHGLLMRKPQDYEVQASLVRMLTDPLEENRANAAAVLTNLRPSNPNIVIAIGVLAEGASEKETKRIVEILKEAKPMDQNTLLYLLSFMTNKDETFKKNFEKQKS